MLLLGCYVPDKFIWSRATVNEVYTFGFVIAMSHKSVLAGLEYIVLWSICFIKIFMNFLYMNVWHYNKITNILLLCTVMYRWQWPMKFSCQTYCDKDYLAFYRVLSSYFYFLNAECFTEEQSSLIHISSCLFDPN